MTVASLTSPKPMPPGLMSTATRKNAPAATPATSCSGTPPGSNASPMTSARTAAG
jgi:hypothetical protein